MAIRRSRTRRLKLPDNIDLGERALKLFNADETDRADEMELRLQRYAKYRQWTGNASQRPWDDASDAAVPDLVTASLRMQDTFVNAVRGVRPCILPKATHKKDQDRQDNIAHLLDYQAFVENGQDGSAWLDTIAEAAVNDGHFTLFVPWVEEDRKVYDVQLIPGIPDEVLPANYFADILLKLYQGAQIEPKNGDYENAWDYIVTKDKDTFPVSFYTTPSGEIEIVETRVRRIFDGPKLIPKDRADVLHPPYVENLQPPGPSNPNGSPHVILVDRPTVDEISKLQRSGWYDRISREEVEKLRKGNFMVEENAQKDQKMVMSGNASVSIAGKQETGMERVTRLQVFDVLDIDGDGIAEDVVYWVIKENKQLLRVRRLSEVYPSRYGWRPFAEAPFIRISGQRTGLGILELGEGLHDLKKMIMDQAVDHGSMMLSPFFFYRPNSSMKPEAIRLFPGEGYPLSNPQQDVYFPTIPPNGQSFAVNQHTLIQQDFERLTMVGDISLGRVPAGKASALRTSDNMALILQQTEARPEHLLHNFFGGLARAWALMHELNLTYLSGEKQIRVYTSMSDQEDPYKKVTKADIQGSFEFEFQANAFNTSRSALQSSIQALLPAYSSPLAIQAGLTNAGTLYKMFEAYGQSWGQQPTRNGWLAKPQMQSITVEEAILSIMNGVFPNGMPLEGIPAHMAGIQQFVQSDDFGHFSQEQVQMLDMWLKQLQQMLQFQQQQMARAAAAAGQGGPVAAQGQGGAAPGGPGGNPMMSPNELLDESLPTAGGGANASNG